MNVREEIERAIKHENPNWDGKSFDYGCSIYLNVLECYEAIEPLIEKAGHSGASYYLFVNKLTRALQGKVLTPITEEDFDGVGTGLCGKNEDGSITEQCKRYSSLFKKTDKDGNVSYSDNDRIIVVDQHNGAWHSWWSEELCKEYIPPINLPYMPTDKPIKIYAWEFTYDPTIVDSIRIERGEYNAVYIHRIVFPNGEIKEVNKMYWENDKNTAEIRVNKEFYQQIKEVVEKEAEEWKKL